jgi:ATP-binding cassette subfamily B protein/ATP-binding cassette subfamily C protein
MRECEMKISINKYWLLLNKYLQSQWKRVLLMMVVLFLNIVLRLYNPQIMRDFIDAALAGGHFQELLELGIVFLCIAVVTQALAVLSKFSSEMVAWTATNALRIDLLQHCLKLDQAFHKAHKPGELIERIDGDVDTLSNFFSGFTTNIIANFILVCGIVSLLFREDWRVGAGLAAFAVVGIIVLVTARKIAIPYWRKVRKIRAEFFGFLGEQLTGTEEIRANGSTGYVMQRFFQTLQRWFSADIKASIAGYSMWMTSNLTFTIGTAIAFTIGAYLWYREAITIGTVYLIVHYTGLLRGPMAEIRTQLSDLQRAEASMGRIEKLVQRQTRIADGPVDALPDKALQVAFDNVSFAYNDEIREGEGGNGETRTHPLPESNGEIVLHNLTFNLEPGRVLGLLGRTGSGKTTLARLLIRFHDPTEGEIRLAECRLTDLTVGTLRKSVSLVTQEVQLFKATIRDNLTFFDYSIPDEKLYGVFDTLGLSPWLEQQTDGLNTMLASGGGGLSAGQAQLLALARIFLYDPGLVILDEASSRLDPMTEYLMEQAMDKLLENRTAIIIAHHLDTVNRADDIMILDRGEILEYGDRLSLSADATTQFYNLLQAGMDEMLV